jgi:hypothetical protein
MRTVGGCLTGGLTKRTDLTDPAVGSLSTDGPVPSLG